MGGAADYDIAAAFAEGEALPPLGVMVRLPDEDAAPVTQGGVVIGTHVYSPAGSLALNPDDVLREAVVPSGVRNGCCGPDGRDGPNVSCVCGRVLGTEWGDCWTQAEVRFLPDAVSLVD